MTHTNPLIAKWEELHNPKKEEPKPQKTHTEKLKELRDTSTIPITKLTSYDVDSSRDSFLQVAEKVKNGEAKVSYIRIDRDVMSGTSITFEVLTNF